MNILVINAGSSSIKYQLIEIGSLPTNNVLRINNLDNIKIYPHLKKGLYDFQREKRKKVKILFIKKPFNLLNGFFML